ncbi:MAG TPA: hypothetical protein VN648_22345, partial [Candidatus Methylomirabilis sp.]|nr:hypothetical protein [Candidatus Methylomirabilis sp.]
KMVLLSALTALPPGIGDQYQFIGNLDELGWINSRLNVPHTMILGAMHHLNRALPFHLDAIDCIRSVEARPAMPARS